EVYVQPNGQGNQSQNGGDGRQQYRPQPGFSPFDHGFGEILQGQQFLVPHFQFPLGPVDQQLRIVQQDHPVVHHDSGQGDDPHHGHHDHKGTARDDHSPEHPDKAQGDGQHDDNGFGKGVELEDQDKENEPQPGKECGHQKIHLLVLFLDLPGIVDLDPSGNSLEILHFILDLSDYGRGIGIAGGQGGIDGDHPLGVPVLDGGKSSGIRSIGHCGDGHFPTLSGGGVPKGYPLVEQGGGVVSVPFPEPNI